MLLVASTYKKMSYLGFNLALYNSGGRVEGLYCKNIWTLEIANMKHPPLEFFPTLAGWLNTL